MRWAQLLLVLALLLGLVAVQATSLQDPAAAQAPAPAFGQSTSQAPAAPEGAAEAQGTSPAPEATAQSPATPGDGAAATADAGASSSAAAGPTADGAQAVAQPAAEEARWVATHRLAELWSESQGGTSFGSVRPFSYFQLTDRATEDRLYVWNPRTENYAWIEASAVGPSSAPPESYLRGPQVLSAVQKPGRIVGGFNMRSYPAVRDDTLLRQLGHNAAVFVQESVVGEDGETWYRVGEDEYVHASGVRLPKDPPQKFRGRWLDVDLNEPAMIAAYEGDQLVYTALTIKGTRVDPTPTGVYRIMRRVANETMDSATIGIPRNSARGYYLRNVLYTQYFTGGGASLGTTAPSLVAADSAAATVRRRTRERVGAAAARSCPLSSWSGMLLFSWQRRDFCTPGLRSGCVGRPSARGVPC